MKKHLTVLKEGEAVSINTFQLKDYLGEFRTNPYPYKITFFRTTKVKAADDFLEYYPEKYFSDFENILSGKLDKNVLVGKFIFSILNNFENILLFKFRIYDRVLLYFQM